MLVSPYFFDSQPKLSNSKLEIYCQQKRVLVNKRGIIHVPIGIKKIMDSPIVIKNCSETIELQNLQKTGKRQLHKRKIVDMWNIWIFSVNSKQSKFPSWQRYSLDNVRIRCCSILWFFFIYSPSTVTAQVFMIMFMRKSFTIFPCSRNIHLNICERCWVGKVRP